MKRKGLAHVVILGGLLAFVTLFLMGFISYCFLVPRTASPQERETLIPITTAERESPAIPGLPNFVGNPTVAFLPTAEKGNLGIPALPMFVGKPSVRLVEELPPVVGARSLVQEQDASIPLPPPDHLIWLPRIPELVVVPAMPRTITASSKLYVPDEPFLFEPMVLSEEEYDMFYPVMTDPQDLDDDFFSDFFVVGADSTVDYEDGLYYLGLFVNDDYMGDIEVQFEEGVQSVSTAELSQYIGQYITDDASARLFGDELDYLTIEEINNRGVEAVYDSAAFTVSLTFVLEDMPERSVSITATSINRREQYGLSGAVVLEPAKFSVASSLSLYTLLDYAPTPSFELTNSLATLSISNRLAIFGVGINFSLSISTIASPTSTDTSFTLGAWNGFYDFVETSQRLSFGNVGSSLTNKMPPSASSSPFGLQFEKNYSYGTDRAKGNQFEYKIVLVEPSTIVISINDTELFTRKFSAGTYRLKDFVFTQGANVVKIVTIPDARPDDPTVVYVDMGYDYRLLGKGDTLYGIGLTVPKEKSPTQYNYGWIPSLPWYNDQYLSYHLDKYTVTYWQQVGVTNTFTFLSDLAFSPGVFNGMVNGVFASMLGTSQIQLTLGLDDTHVQNGWFSPTFGGTFNHRFSGKSEARFGTVNVGVTFLKPYPSNTIGTADPPISFGGNLSYSGNFTKEIRFTLSSSITQIVGNSAPSWNVSFSSGFSPFKGMSLNGTLSLNAQDSDPFNPTLTAQITGSYSFSQKLSATASTSQQTDKRFSSVTGSSSLGISYRPSARDSLNLNLSGFKFASPQDHSLVGGWSHSGDLFSFSLRQQASNSYQRMTTTFTANTAIAYAGGAFALGKSVNEAFFIIKPVGELKNAKVSVARSLDSSPTALRRTLGSALFNNISTNTKNTVLVFSTGSTEYSTGTSFVYELTPRSRQAFMTKIDIQPSFTLSGILLKEDKSPYEQYSSPVYSVTTNEEGKEVMTRSEILYLFTDQDGRYILSDVLPGDYLFDLRVDDLWYSVRFTVPEVQAGKTGKDRVLLLEQFWVADPAFEQRITFKDAFTQENVEEEVDAFGTELVTGYDADVTLSVLERIDEEQFWKIIFPAIEQDDWSFEETIQPEEIDDEFFVVPVEDPETPQDQTVMIDPETMQNDRAVQAEPVPQEIAPEQEEQIVETVSVVPVSRELAPPVPNFSSVSIQSVWLYEEEQQTLASEKVEEEPSSAMGFPEMDQETPQDPPLVYSAP